MSAERLFVDNLPLIDDTIRRVCHQRRCTPEESEDFRSESHLRLIEDDYAVLRKYEGRARSSLRTYLTSVILNQLFDYWRHHRGTWRVSAEARRLGPAAEALDTLLHRDRVPREEAIARLCASGEFRETADELRRLAERLPPHFPRIVEGEDALDGLSEPKAGADRVLKDAEHAATKRAASEALASAMAELSDEDQLVFRLRYQHDLTVPRITQMLGLEAKEVYRRCDRLRDRLRSAMERRGISAAAVLECLGEDSWGDDGEGSH